MKTSSTTTTTSTTERALLALLALGGMLSLAGCDQSNFGQSCGGSPVLACQAYEWAEIEEASLTPEAIRLGDVSARARVRVSLRRCDQAPAPHEVSISIVIPESATVPDGGTTEVEIFGLATVRDDDAGDEAAGLGEIDVEIDNPFGTGIPANRDGRLRFEAISTNGRGCGSGTFEVPYRTGTTEG